MVGVLEVKPWYLSKIPKVAHCYYGGKMPWLRYASILSFAKHNPDWTLRVYRPVDMGDGRGVLLTFGEVAARTYEGECYSDRLRGQSNIIMVPVDFEKIGFSNWQTETFKADYMRLLTMASGGVWIDSDIIFFRPLEESYFNTTEMGDICNVLHITMGDAIYHSTGLVMAAGERNIFKTALEKASVSFVQGDTQSLASKLLNMISVNIADISQHYGSCINLCDDYVYPLNVSRFVDIFDFDVKFDTWQTIGLHWYGGAEKAEKCTKGMNAENWKTYNNSISRALDMAGVV